MVRMKKMTKNGLSCLEDVIEVDENPEDELDKSGTTIGTKFSRIAWNPNLVFNEMWFLTIDPFVGISVFVAKAFQATTLLACHRRLSQSRRYSIL